MVELGLHSKFKLKKLVPAGGGGGGGGGGAPGLVTQAECMGTTALGPKEPSTGFGVHRGFPHRTQLQGSRVRPLRNRSLVNMGRL